MTIKIPNTLIKLCKWQILGRVIRIWQNYLNYFLYLIMKILQFICFTIHTLQQNLYPLLFYILQRGKLLKKYLLTQGYCQPRLFKSLKNCYGRHHNIFDKYDASVSKIPWIYYTSHSSFTSKFGLPHVADVVSQAGTACPSRAHGFTFILKVHAFNSI